MGSPSRVAVPCASTWPIAVGASPAASSAARMTSPCPLADGAVYAILSAPSLLTAVPAITAAIRSPSRRASASRLRTTAPTPSLGTVPPASASKGRQCPSSARIPPGSNR